MSPEALPYVLEEDCIASKRKVAAPYRPTDPQVWPKLCGCGRSYSKEAWPLLKSLGQHVDDWEALDLRNCICGSTIAIVVMRFKLDPYAQGGS